MFIRIYLECLFYAQLISFPYPRNTNDDLRVIPLTFFKIPYSARHDDDANVVTKRLNERVK